MVESAFETVAAASQQAWDGLMQELLLLYRSKLRQADRWNRRQLRPSQEQEQEQGQGQEAAPGSGPALAGGDGGEGTGGPSGGVVAPPGHDLMVISCSRLQGLVAVCCGSDEARAAARRQIAEADPPSEAVPMAKVGGGWWGEVCGACVVCMYVRCVYYCMHLCACCVRLCASVDCSA